MVASQNNTHRCEVGSCWRSERWQAVVEPWWRVRTWPQPARDDDDDRVERTRSKDCWPDQTPSCRSHLPSWFSLCSWIETGPVSVQSAPALYCVSQCLRWGLTLWRPLLPYGYGYKAYCARPIKPSFVFLTSGHSDAQGWASECPDVKITNDGLTRSCTGCFIAAPETRSVGPTPIWLRWHNVVKTT